MRLIYTSDSKEVRDGMDDMMQAIIGYGDGIRPYIELPVALLVVELAKRAEDREEWFPHGKSATIQTLEARVCTFLDRAIATAPTPRHSNGQTR